MKYLLTAVLFAVTLNFAPAQSANDKRGFQGNVISQTKNGKAEDTTIQFTGRSIVVDSDSYDIVKKEFDGKNKTTFTCTKRRATFEIVYAAGESITITDQSNKEAATVYGSLKE